MRHLFVLVAVVWGLAACSSPKAEDGAGTGVDVKVTFDSQIGGTDAANAKGDTAGGDKDTAGQGDAAASDAVSTDTVTTSCDFPTQPAKGESGATCAAAADCQSGYCVDSANGKICTQTCVDCCPGGFKCAQVTGSTDTSFICLPTSVALCRPCVTDAECGKVNGGSLCIDYGAAGRFCGGGCNSTNECRRATTAKPFRARKARASSACW